MVSGFIKFVVKSYYIYDMVNFITFMVGITFMVFITFMGDTLVQLSEVMFQI